MSEWKIPVSALAAQDDYIQTGPEASPSGSSVFGDPLPEFDTIGGTAYAHLEDDSVYLLVQNKHVPFRKDVIDGYNRFRASALSDLRDVRILNTPLGEAACYTLQKPMGGRLFEQKAVGDKVLRTVVLPSILGAFKSLHDEGVTYRSLGPSRLFFATPQADVVMLLESFSVPAGMDQPASYETVARSMVEPVARGQGSPADDYYALGVLIAHLILGRDPIGGRSQQSFEQARLTQGSFASIVSYNGITGAIAALLRGLLQDEVSERWGYADVSSWLNGEMRRAAPTNGTWTLGRPLNFRGKTFNDRRSLAAALQDDPSAGMALYNRRTSVQWVSTLCPGSEAHQAIVNLLDFGNTTKRVDATVSDDDARLARFCSFLDPTGPIRYRNLCLMPDGLGPYFAASYLQENKERLTDLKSLMGGNIWHGLMEIRGLLDQGASQVDQSSQRMSWLSDARQINDGIERALYALNDGLPCLSTQIGAAWVNSPALVLRALNERCRQTSDGIKLDDKDLLAYLAARSSISRSHILSLSTASPEAKQTFLLRLYGELHEHFGSPELKGLAKLFKNRFHKSLGALKSKTRRELLSKKLDAAVEAGDVGLLAKLINVQRLMSADERGFTQAKHKLRKLDKAMTFASRSISPTDPTAIGKAATAGSYLGAFLLLGSILFRVL